MRPFWLALALASGLSVGEVCTRDTCPSGANPKGSMLLQSKSSTAVGSPVKEEKPDSPLIPPEVAREIVVERQRTPRPLFEETGEPEVWLDMSGFDSLDTLEPTNRKQMHDGLSETFGGAVEFVLDMGETYEFSKTRVDFRVCKCNVEGSVLFAVSMDKVNWYTYLSPTLYAWGDHQFRSYAHHMLRGRYLKAWVTELAETQYMEFWEFLIYGRKDPNSHMNVYGWWHSYRTGAVNGLGGTEIMHITPYQGKLFAGTGYWMSPVWRAAEVVRLDCPYCDWVIENVIFPHAARTEILKAVEWTTDKDGNPLPNAMPKLISGFYVDYDGEGRCYASVRDDETTAWDLEVYWAGPWQQNYFSARALEMHRDNVTGVDMLFMVTGRDGIASGTYSATKESKVTFANVTEGGPVPARPLALTRMADRLYFSAASMIKRRIDGTYPSWETVWEHLNVDDVGTVDEAIGGIRGLTAISHNGGPSLLFNWAPNSGSRACMIRLDPTPEGGFQHHQEACVVDLALGFMGTNIDGLEPKIPYSLADYNWALELPTEDGGSVHIIGYQIILFSYSTSDFPTDPAQTWMAASGKPVGFYSGAGYVIRRGPDNYEVREPGGRRYDPAAIYPKLVAVRALARSPWPNDKAAYMGGYDANFFEAEDTAWIMRASFDSIFEAPVPCQPELGCGHTPGMPFQTYGCNWCGFREFAGSKLVSFQDGRAVTCQNNMDFLNSDAGSQFCEIAKEWPSEPICCLGDRCDFCLDRPGTEFQVGHIAGITEAGDPYTCKNAQDYADSGQTTCAQAREWWNHVCCT